MMLDIKMFSGCWQWGGGKPCRVQEGGVWLPSLELVLPESGQTGPGDSLLVSTHHPHPLPRTPPPSPPQLRSVCHLLWLQRALLESNSRSRPHPAGKVHSSTMCPGDCHVVIRCMWLSHSCSPHPGFLGSVWLGSGRLTLLGGDPA